MEKNQNDMLAFEEKDFEPYTLLLDVLKNGFYILLGALAAAMLMYVVVNVKYIPSYTSSATFIVGEKGNEARYGEVVTVDKKAQMLEKILQSHQMKELLCKELEVEEIEAEINAQSVEGTKMLVLSVTADDSKEAFDTIKAILNNYSKVSFYAIGDSVLDILVEPEIPFEPDNRLNVIGPMKKAFLIGALVCAALFALLSYLKDTVKTESAIERKLDAKSLGQIKFERKSKSIKEYFKHNKAAVLVDNPLTGFGFVEDYKKLASKIEYKISKQTGKVLVVTSVSENEGKSTVAANLAITYAEQGKRVVLLDGDIRRPSQFLIFGLDVKEENEFGEFLKGADNQSEIMMKGTRKGLYFLCGKNCYASSTEILQSERLVSILNFLKKKADYIIIDTPPAGVLADAHTFARYADGVLLVAKQNFMLAEDINEIIDDFRDNHANILGVVLNGVRSFDNLVSEKTGGYYGTYGYYGKYNKGR